MISLKLAALLEQITPGIRDKMTYPGDTLLDIVTRLESDDPIYRDDVNKLLRVIHQFDRLPNDAMIHINAIFDKYMHDDLNNHDQLELSDD